MLESAGERGQEVFPTMPHPAKVQNEIYRQMEANSNRMYHGGPAATQPAGASIPEQIEKLDELRQRGVISEQEFEAG